MFNKLKPIPYLLAHALLIGFVLLVLFLITTQFIKRYTRHNQVITLVDLSEMHYEDAKAWLSERNLRDTIIDSTYVKEQLPGTIFDQEPAAGKKVKRNRRIYLSVYSNNPPLEEIPKEVIDRSLRLARSKLSGKFNIVDTREIAGDKNIVFAIEHEGKPVEEGALLPKFSDITLVVGSGLSTTRFEVPCLLGLTLEEARFKLTGNELNLGSVAYDTLAFTDSSSAVVLAQVPPCGVRQKIRMGEAVNVTLTQDLPTNLFDTIQKYRYDTLTIDNGGINDSL